MEAMEFASSAMREKIRRAMEYLNAIMKVFCFEETDTKANRQTARDRQRQTDRYDAKRIYAVNLWMVAGKSFN